MNTFVEKLLFTPELLFCCSHHDNIEFYSIKAEFQKNFAMDIRSASHLRDFNYPLTCASSICR